MKKNTCLGTRSNHGWHEESGDHLRGRRSKYFDGPGFSAREGGYFPRLPTVEVVDCCAGLFDA